MMSDLYIMHYGVGHDKGGHSGRYPWGSGDNKITRTAKAIKERGVNDVMAEAITKHMSKTREFTEEEYIANKEKVKQIIKNVEMYSLSTLVGTLFGIGGSLALRGVLTYKDIKEVDNNIDKYIEEYNDVKIDSIKGGQH